MELKPLQRTFIPDKNLSQFQDSVTNHTDQFKDTPFLKGILLEDVKLTTSGSQVAHKLGSTPKGYMLLKSNAAANVYSTAIDDKFLSLKASADVTVSLWVF